MSNLVHVSDLVQAQEMIRVLTEKNVRLKAAAEKWELTFKAQIEKRENKFDLAITARAGERAVIRRVTQEELMSFTGDLESISDELAVQLLVRLFEQQIKDALRQEFIPTARKVQTLVEKFGE